MNKTPQLFANINLFDLLMQVHKILYKQSTHFKKYPLS